MNLDGQVKNRFSISEMLKLLFKEINILKKNNSTPGGVQTVTGDGVDNTDPSNPVLDRGYKVYSALVLNDLSTSEPIATELENTLGDNVQWTRGDTGLYYINLENESLFSFDKTFVLISLPLTASNTKVQYSILSPSTIVINTFLSNNTAGDVLGEVGLGQTSIEIRVYN